MDVEWTLCPRGYQVSVLDPRGSGPHEGRMYSVLSVPFGFVLAFKSTRRGRRDCCREGRRVSLLRVSFVVLFAAIVPVVYRVELCIKRSSSRMVSRRIVSLSFP